MAIKLEDGEELDVLGNGTDSTSGGYQMPDFGMGGGAGIFDGGIDVGSAGSVFDYTKPSYTGGNLFGGGTDLVPTFNMVQQGEGGGATTTTDATGNIVTLPSYVVNAPRDTSGGISNIFNPNQLIGADVVGGRGAGGELTGAIPAISLRSGTGSLGNALGGGPTATINVGQTTQTISFDDLVRKELDKEIAAMQREGVFSSDPQYGTRLQVAAERGIEIYNAATAPARNLNVTSSGTPAQNQSGIPLIIPIPGLDPATAGILTAAGLIFSGGKIARFDPNKPVESVVGAVQGVGQTGQNVVDVATGKTDLGTIWSGGTGTSGSGGGAGAGAGTPSSGTGAGAQGAGEQSGNIGTTPIFGGGLGGGGGAGAGTQVSQTTPQVPSAESISAAQAVQQQSQAAAVAAAAARQQAVDAARKATELPGNLGQPSAIGSGPKGGDVSILNEPPVSKVGPGLKEPTGLPSSIGSGKKGGDVSIIDNVTPKVYGGLKEPTQNTQTGTSVPTTTVPSSTTPTTSTGGTASTFIINPMASGYTLPTTGTPAQRNLYQEATTTTQALGSPMQQAVIGMDSQGKPIYGNVPIDPATGQPMTVSQGIASGYGGLARGMTAQDISNLLQSIGAQTGTPVTGGYQAALTQAANEQTAAANTALRAGNIADAENLFARAQALRTQANPQLYGETGALPQFTTAAQNQVARDIAALRQAEAGQLTQEQIRNAQQAAREAYGARGQVFSQGAAAQEVLNRANMIQQQQQLARQNLAQSMGQLGQGIGYQTANIFDPFATTLGQQYGMQTQNVGMNQALYNQAMGLTSGAGGYGFAQQMINPFSNYAMDVYGTNVNALNAAQIQAANRQAALEAAKMGQTGAYAQALGGLIASGGLGQIQSGLSSGIGGLLSLLGGQWPGSTTTVATPRT